ncbi:MAG: polyprenyl synthetase family protein [Bacteroidales bacterium]
MAVHSIEKLREIIDSEIIKMDFAALRPGELYMPVSYIMSNGGKRLRPSLTLMACNLFSDDLLPAIKPAVAIELFHNFTLLHDDIMDKAEMRRGKPTVHKKWDENTAILSGDAMVVMSFKLISSTNPDILPSMLSVFNRTALEVCEGQQLDINYENMPEVDEAGYLEMIRLKTSVLIAASMSIGAIAGGASPGDASLLYDSGMNLGLAFQLQDDLLDLYGSQEEFGKMPGGDILMNKKTYLLIKALEQANDETAGKIRSLMENEKDPHTKIREVTGLFNELNIKAVTEKKAETYFNLAIENLNLASPVDERKTELTSFIKKVMNRKS